MARKKELHEGVAANLPNNGPKVSGMNEVLCKHKDTGKPFACGLCRSCYEEVSSHPFSYFSLLILYICNDHQFDTNL